MKNQIKTAVLLTVMGAIFMAVGNWAGGSAGMTTALVMAILMNAGAYWFSDRIVLAVHGARPLPAGHPSGVYEITADLCRKAGLPMPRLYVVPSRIPNAFATGRGPRHAAVAVTEGILEILSERELRAVLSHELSHIRNRDILVSTIVASFASALMYLAHMLQWTGLMGGHRGENDRGPGPLGLVLTIVLAPLAAALIQAAVSRTREYMADDSGADISEDPEALAAALTKISDPSFSRRPAPGQASPELQSAFAHMYIVNQFSGESIMNLFSTHPPVKDRVRRLLSKTKAGRI